jgi:autotransporter-associated beta strand protein
MSRHFRGLMHLEDRLTPAIATWDGGAADNHWSTPANWVGDVAPQAGDALVFPASVTQSSALNDFAAGTAFDSISITSVGYQINGSAATLTNGVTASSTDFGNTILGIDIAGAGGVTKSGTGVLTLTGNNSYLGTTLIQGGSVSATTATALGATGAGNGTVISGSDQFNPAFVRLMGGTLNFSEPFTLGNSSELISEGVITLTAPVTLTGSSTAFRNLQAGVNSGDKLIVTSGVAESGGSCGLTLSGFGGQIVFPPGSINTYTGATSLDGTVVFNGQATTSAISSFSGHIQGAGSIGAVTVGFIGIGGSLLGSLDPGTAGIVGTLTTGNLNLSLGGTLGIDATSAAVDKLAVNGTVQISCFLAMLPAAGFVPTIGSHYRLIDNDGTDAVSGTFFRLSEGAVVRTINHVALRVTYHGGDGNDVELVGAPEQTALAVGPGPGTAPSVNVYGGNGTLLRTFVTYNVHFFGGVRVATGDITGDGIDDIITAPGPGGGPHIRVWDGVTFTLVREFMAYDPAFFGGVFVAAGDINHDGRTDIITGAGAGGGPHVKVFSGVDNSVIGSFLAYDPRFTGGVTATAFNGQVVTGPGAGGGPDVRQFAVNGGTATMVLEFLAFDASFFGGVFVGSTRGPAKALGDDLIVGAGAGGGPHIKVFRIGGVHNSDLLQVTEFFAYDASFRSGVRVAGADLDGDGADEIITGAGPSGGPHVKAWDLAPGFGNPPTLGSSFFAFDPAFTGGIYVG